jgi:hypothetical protein
VRECRFSTKGFFYELLPLLEHATPFGHLAMDPEGLSIHFRVSLHMTRRYLSELKARKILKESEDGDLICPALIRESIKNGR